jgi:chromosome segregation ATPase
VAGVWAVAATAVGLIALLDTSGDEAERGVGQVAERVEALERGQARSERRLEALAERIDALPQAEDLDTLEGRISSVKEDVGEASSSASGAADRIDDLEQRVEELGRAPDSPGGAGAGAGPDSP